MFPFFNICPGCNNKVKKRFLCYQCDINFHNIMGLVETPPKKLYIENASFPVFSLCSYTNSNKRIINSWKNHGNEYFNPYIKKSMIRLMENIKPIIKKYSPLCFVRIPSNPLNVFQKKIHSFSTTTFLCNLLVKHLKNYNVIYKDILQRKISSKNQVGLGFLQRTQNRNNSTLVKRKIYMPIILVDDILTTGASILDAEKALSLWGMKVLFAIVLATTPIKGIYPISDNKLHNSEKLLPQNLDLCSNKTQI